MQIRVKGLSAALKETAPFRMQTDAPKFSSWRSYSTWGSILALRALMPNVTPEEYISNVENSATQLASWAEYCNSIWNFNSRYSSRVYIHTFLRALVKDVVSFWVLCSEGNRRFNEYGGILGRYGHSSNVVLSADHRVAQRSGKY
jgi:hypothetical protein